MAKYQILSGAGYWMIKAPLGYNGKIYSTGYIYEHRYVLEQKIGRYLESDEIAHHLNENKNDNRPENLGIKEKTEHNSFHGKARGLKTVILKCPNCNITFERPKRQTHLQKGGTFTTCSKSCRGKFSRKLCISGMTSEISILINQNIIKEYKKFPYAPVSQLDREAAYEAEG